MQSISLQNLKCFQSCQQDLKESFVNYFLATRFQKNVEETDQKKRSDT